jgi:hypothetical protein
MANALRDVQPSAERSRRDGNLCQSLLDRIGVESGYDTGLRRILNPQQHASGAKMSEGWTGEQQETDKDDENCRN